MRPLKKGLDYFPLDTNFIQDIKVRKIMRAQRDAIGILIALLCTIYNEEGYYMGFGDDECFLISEDAGVSEGAVMSVVEKALQVNFFNQQKYDDYQILTSRGIQRRYFEATSRRKNISVNEAYLLIDLADYDNINSAEPSYCQHDVSNNPGSKGVNVNINSINDDRSTQRKEKKSKVKQSKEKNTARATRDVVVLENNEFTDKVKATVKVYEQAGFGEINAIVAAKIKELVETYSQEWIHDAFSIAAENNKHSLSYVRGILENWRRKGKQVKSYPQQNKNNQAKIADSRTSTYSADQLNAIAEKKRQAMRQQRSN